MLLSVLCAKATASLQRRGIWSCFPGYSFHPGTCGGSLCAERMLSAPDLPPGIWDLSMAVTDLLFPGSNLPNLGLLFWFVRTWRCKARLPCFCRKFRYLAKTKVRHLSYAVLPHACRCFYILARCVSDLHSMGFRANPSWTERSLIATNTLFVRFVWVLGDLHPKIAILCAAIYNKFASSSFTKFQKCSPEDLGY